MENHKMTPTDQKKRAFEALDSLVFCAKEADYYTKSDINEYADTIKQALQAEQKWLDISCAPKPELYYGDEIILSDGKETYFGHWYKSKWYRRDCSDLMDCNPTHWQPLPPPPENPS